MNTAKGYEPERYMLIRVEEDGEEREIPASEFFVLRRGDMLAYGTLWNYLANIQLVLEYDDRMPTIGVEKRRHLEKLRDDVEEIANRWQADTRPVRLPD
jgi:hypothetical protein